MAAEKRWENVVGWNRVSAGENAEGCDLLFPPTTFTPVARTIVGFYPMVEIVTYPVVVPESQSIELERPRLFHLDVVCATSIGQFQSDVSHICGRRILWALSPSQCLESPPPGEPLERNYRCGSRSGSVVSPSHSLKNPLRVSSTSVLPPQVQCFTFDSPE